MGGTLERSVVQLLCVESQTERSFDTRAESLGVSYTKYEILRVIYIRNVPRAKTPALLIFALMKAAESR
jgi:hypothetical protein